MPSSVRKIPKTFYQNSAIKSLVFSDKSVWAENNFKKRHIEN